MRVIVVNEKDEVIGHKERKDANEHDITRISGLWIFNSNKELLLAQRSFNKTHSRGKWGPAVAGTVEEGETYVSNIIKEAREELGVTITEEQLITGPHEFRETSHKYFHQTYAVKVDLPIESFKLQEEEVASIRWVPIEELCRWVREKPDDFTPSTRAALEEVRSLARI